MKNGKTPTRHLPKAILFSAILLWGCASNGTIPASNGSGPVRESRPISSGKYRTVVLEDLDNDGFLDVAAGGAPPATISIGYGDGSGRISTTLFLPVKGDVQSLAIADIDNDGLKDVVFSIQQEAAGIMIWLNGVDRNWTRGKGPATANTYQGIAVLDVNRDGHSDIVAANATTESRGGVQVWLGDGKGNWPVQTGPTDVGKYMDIAVADFNGDDFLDIAAGSWGVDGQLRLWYGDGSGGWSSGAILEQGSFYGVRAADLNGDGHLDIIATTYRAGVSVFVGDGKGGFADVPKPQDWGSFWDVAVTDLDKDGARNLVATSIDGNGLQTWQLRDGKSWEPEIGRFPTSGTYYEISAGDFNRDGYEDLCAASFGEGIKFWHGKKEIRYTSLRDLREAAVQKQEVAEAIEENDVYTMITGFPEYKIGPGDLLEITIWQATTPTREEVLVRPDGNITFGFVDDLRVKGKTPSQLDERLTQIYREYMREPRIDVIVKEYNSKFVSLTGAIGRGVRTTSAGTGTGKYPLTGKNTLIEIVAKAGGPSMDANLREIRVRRKSGEAFSINLYRAIYQGDVTQDLVLDDGDLVYFPTLVTDANRVYVFGEVFNPGVIELSESNMRVADAIMEAGGPTVFALKREVRVVRGNVNQPDIFQIDVKRLLEEGDQTQNIRLSSGDFVFVPRSFFGDVNQFWTRIRPLFELVIAPARTVNEWDDALNQFGAE